VLSGTASPGSPAEGTPVKDHSRHQTSHNMTPNAPGGQPPLDRVGPAIALGYFLVAAGLRQLASPTIDLDQAEQVLLAQVWSLGYTEQPPLYTWLVAGLFALTGPSALVLYLLKAVLLASTALALGIAAWRLGFEPARQRAALIGLILLPQFIWESQRDVTHSTLASTLAALAIAQALAFDAHSHWRSAITLGATFGAGLLAKHNFLLLLPLIALVVLDRPAAARPPLRGLMMALLALLLVAAPHELWLLLHPEASARGLAKLGRGEGGLAMAMASSGLNALAFLSPLWLFALLVRDWGGSVRHQATDARLLRWLTAALLPVVLVLVLGEARGFKDRWFQPLLIWSVLFFAAGAALDSGRWRAVRALALGFALLVPLALDGRLLLAGPLGRAERPNIPYATLARLLEAESGGEVPAAIIAERKLLAGNLRLAWPQVPVRSREVAAALPRPPSGRWLVVCEVERCEHNDFPGWLAEYTGVAAPEAFAGQVSAPAYYLPERLHTLKYAWIPVP
jgi:hypothetical protein